MIPICSDGEHVSPKTVIGWLNESETVGGGCFYPIYMYQHRVIFTAKISLDIASLYLLLKEVDRARQQGM